MLAASIKKSYLSLTIVICALYYLLAVPLMAQGQQDSPGSLFRKNETPPENTGPFIITGDRMSTIEAVTEPIMLPPETRSIESLPSLKENEKPLSRSDTFTERHGAFASFKGYIGSNTPLVMSASASFDDKNQAGTIRLYSRNQKQNTPSNLAPQVLNLEAFGYREISLGKLSGDIHLKNESDNILGDLFRFRDRRRETYSLGAGLKPSPWGGWSLDGRARLKGGHYHDFETHENVNETIFYGQAKLSGDIDEASVTANSSLGLFGIKGKTGSLFQLGADGVWLPMDEFSIKGGAGFTVTSLPGERAGIRFCPVVNARWAISGTSFAGLSVKREVISHSFSDLYGQNGLVTYSIPLLFEDRKYDITAEYGRTLKYKIKTTGELFTCKSENAPVFSRKENFFEIIPDARVSLTGIKAKAEYDLKNRWGAKGEFSIKKASWNFSGDVPYIPLVEASASGYFIPDPLWRIYGTFKFMGKHHVEKGSDDIAKAFLTIDIGAEREILKKYIDGYVDIKNLLNSSGAWWTDEYRIPGIGVYAGVKARY
jgi:hypothetical protein